MLETLGNLPVLVQALLGTGFTWFMTALGAATIFLGRNLGRKTLDWMLGFAAGVMIAASYWSLLAPAIALAEENGDGPAWVPAVVGFLLGGAFLRGLDLVLPHLHLNMPITESEGLPTTWRRTTLLVLAITLHNIPEGLAVGVAFGAAAFGDIPGATLAGAVALARHRHPELPGGDGREHAAAPGRMSRCAASGTDSSAALSSRLPACSARSPSCNRGPSCPTRSPSPPAP